VKVWIVHEEPDMTYYGGAEVYGVYSNPEAAEEMRKQHHRDAVVEEWEIENVVMP
jgi:hypothetical protein